MLQFERQSWDQLFQRVAGVDEAGRGPLAGPVVAAAVIMRRSFAEAEESRVLQGLTDSKQLTESARNTFFSILTHCDSIAFGVGVAEVEEIERLNILQATHRAMLRAVEGLREPPDHILVDGLPVKGFRCSSTAIVRGDALSLSIAAASVVAKVVRDRLMVVLDREYPLYGFAKHKGYGTSAHMQALLEFGPCPAHRRTFRPVRDALELHHRAQAPSQDPRFAAGESPS